MQDLQGQAGCQVEEPSLPWLVNSRIVGCRLLCRIALLPAAHAVLRLPVVTKVACMADELDLSLLVVRVEHQCHNVQRALDEDGRSVEAR